MEAAMEKRAYRVREGKVIAGVCAGLGDYFSIDPLFVRIFFVLLICHPPIAFLGYIVLWIAMPVRKRPFDDYRNKYDDDDHDHTIPLFSQKEKKSGRQDNSLAGGLMLIGVGVLFLIANFVPSFDFADYWPILLIALGASLIFGSLRPLFDNSKAEA
jgi:phage shock protein PspC (stress-responsive transcriptional regulator)